MTINATARRHGHGYTRSNFTGTPSCPACLAKSGVVTLTCEFDSETPRYWVLPLSAYSDTERDYIAAENKAECATVGLVDLGYLDNPGASVYDGTRTPWDEEDPYPDWTIERGPRGGVKWERA